MTKDEINYQAAFETSMNLIAKSGTPYIYTLPMDASPLDGLNVPAWHYPGCSLNVHIFKVFGGRYDYNGMWIIINSRHSHMVFHFPLNSGQTIIVSSYDKQLGKEPSEAMKDLLHPLFGKIPFNKVRKTFGKTSATNFLSAYMYIEKQVRNKYCK